MDENGAEVGYDELWWGGSIAANIPAPATGTLRIGVLPSPWGGVGYNYTLETSLVDRAELVVADLAVAHEPTLEQARDADASVKRTIAFNVSNQGPGHGDAVITVIVTTPDDGMTTVLLSRAEGFASQQSAHYELAWDAAMTGTVGEAIVTATASTYFGIGGRDVANARSYGMTSETNGGRTIGVGYQQSCVREFPVGQACTDWTIRPGSYRASHGSYAFLTGYGSGSAVLDGSLAPSPRLGSCVNGPVTGTCQSFEAGKPPVVGPQQVCVVALAYSCTDWYVSPDHTRVAHGEGNVPFVGRVDEVIVWADTSPSPGAGACISVGPAGTCQSLP